MLTIDLKALNSADGREIILKSMHAVGMIDALHMLTEFIPPEQWGNATAEIWDEVASQVMGDR